jgi:ADP-ribosylglycohydrolase
VRIDETVYRDKVLGCWLGKNAGGTLGGPLEQKFGQEEMFDVSWYPELPEGGIPNDDLELQLIWLQALREHGPGIVARDLAEYWLDCIRYNFDEYGLSKTNLQKGLVPPVSGWHNNWFKHCMGSPIRSEIWACVAPGTPEIAAAYAFEDAICDHAGGESVFGEVFNAVLESCAFVISDRVRLIEIGLSAIPPECLTHRAVRRALGLFGAGLHWKAARHVIKDEFYMPVAQYSPINLGFQTIALLYGEDFGDAICKAANCGWDTDCTAATIGAILGIIMGAKQLPGNWLAPLGYEISTNLTTGGIRHLRAPTDINVLTDEVCKLAPRVLQYWNAGTVITADGDSSSSTPDFRLNSSWLVTYDPGRITWDLDTLVVSLRYNEHAAITGSEPARFEVEIVNPRPEPVRVSVAIQLPEEWVLRPNEPVHCAIESLSRLSLAYTAAAPAAAIADSNSGTIQVEVPGRPALLRLPLVFLGGTKWMVSPVLPDQTIEADCGFDESRMIVTPPESWVELWRPGNDLQVEGLFGGRPGVIYLLHFIQSDAQQDVVLGVSNNGRMKLWLNGTLQHETRTITPIRPNQGNGGGDGANYSQAILRQGWNQVLIKLERGSGPLEAHFTIGLRDIRHPKCVGHAVLGLRRTQSVWEMERIEVATPRGST